MWNVILCGCNKTIKYYMNSTIQIDWIIQLCQLVFLNVYMFGISQSFVFVSSKISYFCKYIIIFLQYRSFSLPDIFFLLIFGIKHSPLSSSVRRLPPDNFLFLLWEFFLMSCIFKPPKFSKRQPLKYQVS